MRLSRNIRQITILTFYRYSDMSEQTKTNLLGLTTPQMEAFFDSIGEKRFRTAQVMKWIHHYGVDNFDEMTNLSKVLRAKLKEVAEVRGPEIVYQDFSDDGTRKWVLKVDGGSCIETVLIPMDEKRRVTPVVHDQVRSALRVPERLLGAPPVLLKRFPLPGEDGDSLLSDGRRGVVLGGVDVA